MNAPVVDEARSWQGYESPEVPVRWDLRDVLTYAVAVGADPARDGPYLDEAAGPLILPTFATFAAGPWTPHLHRTIWAGRHGAAASIAYRVHRPVPLSGTATTRVRVSGFEVKPTALLVWLTTSTTGPDGPLLSGRHSVLFQGGGARRTSGDTGPWAGPVPATGAEVLTAEVRVDPRAIALYRLLLPLVPGRQGPDLQHVSAEASAAAGLGAPALHGAAVLGHLGLAMTRILGGRIGGVGGFGARFRAPVRPGDRLVVSACPPERGEGWAVRVSAEGRTVVDQAWLETRSS
ncbi:MaoC/PaaZ C-terminal domain-containing protein [Amycolatopsis pithecellobii]|uniref:MaoC-like domain-containing protein n=1 Tax=Amycolatopsis pithecellobii TaxID=664692 RepID=A0A6N7YT86_9PSEU|nr:MaoC/PaaZ C-terminal domain-containing protein [Amycolatopsis pithecellobii]MTD55158.1 hypothetical protein [Amycolatopsis pithecellobii]